MLIKVMVKERGIETQRGGRGLIVCMGMEVSEIRPRTSKSFWGEGWRCGEGCGGSVIETLNCLENQECNSCLDHVTQLFKQRFKV